jgi:hypothetical protein
LQQFLTGALADPVCDRCVGAGSGLKITPRPGLLRGLSDLLFAAAWLGAWINKSPADPQVIPHWRQQLQTPAMLFVGLLAMQAMHEYGAVGQPHAPAIGLVFIWPQFRGRFFCAQFAIRAAGTRWHSECFVVLCLGASLFWFTDVVAETNGVSSRALGEVGVGQIIYSFGLNKESGVRVYRASEVAAWHIAMVSCCMFIC